ncbi:MAG TPA: hypothetical protein VF174_16735 [Micromonosporaceae bacterium]
MRAVLRFLATRVLRSRAGLAIVIAALVLGIVTAARMVAGPVGPPPALTPVPPLVATLPAEDDDGLASPDAVASPTSIPGAEPPVAVAVAFAGDWIRHDGVSAAEWHARLAERASTELARKLSGVDPAGVPAERITGEPLVIPHSTALVEVVIPVDSGRLHLRLMAVNDRWLVDGVDWERT